MITKSIRRVITGESADGKSFIVRDDTVGSTEVAGIDLFHLWGNAAIPVALPTDGLADPGSARGEGVVRTAVGVLKPRTLVGAGDPGHLHFDSQGFHQTESVDVAFVVSGELTMRVPGEADVRLRAGDCVVQNGARHAWENQTDEPAVILWVWVKGARQGPRLP
jgi:mannose-6-phosphate isomerase-like protein (cupin superfamily)